MVWEINYTPWCRELLEMELGPRFAAWMCFLLNRLFGGDPLRNTRPGNYGSLQEQVSFLMVLPNGGRVEMVGGPGKTIQAVILAHAQTA